MRYTEIDVFGVFVSPVAPMLLLAWIILLIYRSIIDRTGITRHLWHPALANVAVLVIIFSAIVVGAGRLR